MLYILIILAVIYILSILLDWYIDDEVLGIMAFFGVAVSIAFSLISIGQRDWYPVELNMFDDIEIVESSDVYLTRYTQSSFWLFKEQEKFDVRIYAQKEPPKGMYRLPEAAERRSATIKSVSVLKKYIRETRAAQAIYDANPFSDL